MKALDKKIIEHSAFALGLSFNQEYSQIVNADGSIFAQGDAKQLRQALSKALKARSHSEFIERATVKVNHTLAVSSALNSIKRDLIVEHGKKPLKLKSCGSELFKESADRVRAIIAKHKGDLQIWHTIASFTDTLRIEGRSCYTVQDSTHYIEDWLSVIHLLNDEIVPGELNTDLALDQVIEAKREIQNVRDQISDLKYTLVKYETLLKDCE